MDLDKLLAIGDKCIREEPPACYAACPIHVDVIGLVKAIEKKDYRQAYRVMEKRMPFASLVGKICDHPCQKACVRNDKDQAIQISELEKAAVEYGYAEPKKKLPPRTNKGTVAVIGGGVSGLVVARDLQSKGYQIIIYEKSEKLGGYFWQVDDLTSQEINREMAQFDKKGYQIHLNRDVDDEKLQAIIKEADAVYLATASWQENLEINPQTFQVGESSLFAGGALVLDEESLINGISTGRRAAVSIDRYITKVSMLASREREGVFETPLKYPVEQVIPPIEKTAAIYSQEEAEQEANRCLKCQCDACIKACVHMQRYDMPPNAYTRQINQNERIIKGAHYANKMINSCAECGLCKEVCFLDISMKDVIEETRESMVERGKMPVSAHDFALKDMKFSNSERFSLVRKQPTKEASKDLFYYPLICYDSYVKGLSKGSGKTGYLFYPGCQLSASHHQYIEDIYRYLVGSIKKKESDKDVGIYLGCCGAPADWAGEKDLANANTEKIKEIWKAMDQPVFILACSSCMAIFEKYLPEIETVSLWEIYDTYGLPDTKVRPGRPVLNIHDACASRSHSEIHQSIRNIANTLGYKIKELNYSKEEAKCCGYGGLVYYANRDQADDFVRDRIEESDEDLLVYCAMCKDLMVSGGKQTYHILDLIYGENLAELGLRKNPTLSERHQNRSKLKGQLLKNIWKEDFMEDDRLDYIKISEEVEEKMEDRYILVADVQKVILNALETGEYFYDPESQEYLSRLRMDEVTFWVRYKKDGADIVILNTYSHRMEVVEA